MTASWRAWVEYDRRSRRGDLSSDPALEWVCVARRPSRSAALAAAGRVVGGTGRIAAYTDLARPGWRAVGRHLPLVIDGRCEETTDGRVLLGGVDVAQAVLARWPSGTATVEADVIVLGAALPPLRCKGQITGNTAEPPWGEDSEPARLQVGKATDIVYTLGEWEGYNARVVLASPRPVIAVAETCTVQLSHPWGGHKAGSTVIVTRSDRGRLAGSGYLAIP